MDRYLVEVRQEVTTPVTVVADNAEDAQKRVVYGLGEFGDQEAGQLEVVSVRVLEPFGGD